jgi:endoglucanase
MDRRRVLQYAGIWGAASVLPLHRSLARADNSSPAQAVFNQAGYLPNYAKVASVRTNSGGRAFTVISEKTGKTAFSGQLTAPAMDAASGDSVALADFSPLILPGSYRLVTGGDRTPPFSIRKDAYQDALRLSMRSFYGQRCGCAVDLGEGYRHGLCHTSAAYHASSGHTGALSNPSGWHDAGDYGRYIVNSGIAVATLLWAWELFPNALRRLSLGIPESGGKLPDYLAEVRWNLDWMLSLQDEDGGVWHKQTSEKFCGFIMPEDDHLISYVIGTGTEPYKSTCATASLAAVMAIAARCYGHYDEKFAARCLAAARRGWTWAAAHPNVTFVDNPPGVTTGGYGDSHCNDELLWASAELWRTTSEQDYERAFLTSAQVSITAPSWSDVAPMAYWTYALADRKGDAALRAQVATQTATAAQKLLAGASSSGYGTTLSPEEYVWGSNGIAANQSLLLLVANHLQPQKEYVEAALGNLHYLLGRNCFGVSWVTHVGTNPFLHPHHRPSVADHLAAPWPGLLSGGPNAKPADKVADLLPKSPPMRMWVDDDMAYSLNEVAINWNAPLVFLLAAATSDTN